MTTILNLAYGFKVKVINYDFKKEFEVVVTNYGFIRWVAMWIKHTNLEIILKMKLFGRIFVLKKLFWPKTQK